MEGHGSRPVRVHSTRTKEVDIPGEKEVPPRGKDYR